MISAIKFGEKYRSCEEAMIWRRSLPPETTQAEAYLLCQRGDWLAWQLTQNCVNQDLIHPKLRYAIIKIVTRSIRRGVRCLRGNRKPYTIKYRRWARRWLMGEDRSASSAITAADGTAAYSPNANASCHVAAYASDAPISWTDTVAYFAAYSASFCSADVEVSRTKEQKLQAHGIRSEIPAWPGE